MAFYEVAFNIGDRAVVDADSYTIDGFGRAHLFKDGVEIGWVLKPTGVWLTQDPVS